MAKLQVTTDAGAVLGSVPIPDTLVPYIEQATGTATPAAAAQAILPILYLYITSYCKAIIAKNKADVATAQVDSDITTAANG